MTVLDQCRVCRLWPSTTTDGLCDMCATEADQVTALADDMRALIDAGLVEPVRQHGVTRYQLTTAGSARIRSLLDEETS